MEIEWRPVVGSDGLYLVSSAGTVWSVRRQIVLKPSGGRRGHLYVHVCGRTKGVHQLVVEAFHGLQPTPALEVRHLDGDPTNNTPANLKWGTRKENAADRREHGTHNNTVRITCRRRGHALVEPNLDPYHLAHGKRACRSCHWAGVTAQVGNRKGHHHDRDQLADEMYAHLIEGAPDPRERGLTRKIA